MQDEDKKIMRNIIMHSVILIALIFGILLISRRITNTRQMEQIDHYTLELGNRTAQHVGDVLVARREAIASMAYLYGQGLQDDRVDRNQLRELETNPGFDRIRFVNREGESYTSDRKIADVTERDYYQKGMQGFSGFTVVDTSVFDSQSLLGFYAPVYYGGEICGVMVGFVEAPTVTELLKTEFSGYTANTMVIDVDGAVLGQAMAENDPISKNISELEAFMDDPEGLRDALRSHTRFRLNLSGVKGPTLAYAVPIPHTSWTLVQCFPPEAAAESITRVNQDEQVVMLLFFLAVTAFGTQLLFDLKQRGMLERERANAARVSSLLRDVADDYVCLVDVNLKTEQEEQFCLSDGVITKDWAQGDFDYTHCVTSYAQEVVSEKDREEFLSSTKLSRLKMVLAVQRNFYHEYDAVVDGKTRRYQGKYTLCTDQYPEPHILIGIRDITEATKERVKTKTTIELIVSAASTVYPIILEENLTRDRGRTVYNEGIISWRRMEHFSVDEMVEELRKIMPYEEDYAELSRIMKREPLLQAYARGKRDLKIRIRQLGDDGQIHWMSIRKILMENDAGDVYAITMVRCIDEEIHRTEALEQARDAAEAANRAKSTFLFNMSHDIRTPMNAILGFSSMAMRYVNNPEKITDCLEKINLSGGHLLKLINNVLDMARIESGRVELDEQPHSLRDTFSALPCIFQTDAEKKNLEASYQMDISDDVAYYDELRLNEIALNLVSNAIKYTPDGGKIWVTLRQTGCSGGFGDYIFSVKDTGIGMSPEFMDTVFDAFERDHDAIVSGVEGTGLGLAITRRLVESMGGTITCTSKQGAGSEFICRLHLRLGTPADMEKNKPEGVQPLRLEGKRILLVEDNALNREISREILEHDGFLVEEVDDGDVAVEKLRNAPAGYFDLVLMDVQMPRMDGYQATRQIRALADPAIAGIPIIAVTANAFEEDRQAAKDAGMNGHVAKPVDVGLLHQAIQECMNQER